MTMKELGDAMAEIHNNKSIDSSLVFPMDLKIGTVPSTPSASRTQNIDLSSIALSSSHKVIGASGVMSTVPSGYHLALNKQLLIDRRVDVRVYLGYPRFLYEYHKRKNVNTKQVRLYEYLNSRDSMSEDVITSSVKEFNNFCELVIVPTALVKQFDITKNFGNHTESYKMFVGIWDIYGDGSFDNHVWVRLQIQVIKPDSSTLDDNAIVELFTKSYEWVMHGNVTRESGTNFTDIKITKLDMTKLVCMLTKPGTGLFYTPCQEIEWVVVY